MSISFPNTLTNGTTADASQVMANFTAINGSGVVDTAMLAAASVTSPKFKPDIGITRMSSTWSWSTSYQDIPGTSVVLNPTVASVVYVVARWQANLRPLLGAGGLTVEFTGTLNVDASDQTQTGVAGVTIGAGNSNVFDEFTVTAVQAYAVPVAAGAHTFKLRIKNNGSSNRPTGTPNNADATLLYLMVAQ